MSYATDSMAKTRWLGHSDNWPAGQRPCMKCLEMKLLAEFHKHAQCKGGYNSVCKVCRVPLSKKQAASRTAERRIFDSAKSRATKKQRDFDLVLEDIVIPKHCAVFGTLLTDPSIDRIDSNQGYVKGNIRIISRRANQLKNNATVEEMAMVLADLLRLRAGACELI